MTTKLDNTGNMARRALAYKDNASLRQALAQVTPSAMQTLLGAIQHAGSLEEIEIVIRYQQARERRKWSGALVEQILQDLRTSAEGEPTDQTRANVAARQLGLIARVQRAVSEDSRDREENDR